MHRAVSYLPLALLFLASVVPSNGQMRRSEPDANTSERVVTVKLGAPLTVECTLQPQQKVEWRLDGGARPQDMKPVETTSSSDVVVARLTASSALARHAGVYTCAKSSPRIRVKVTGVETSTAAAETPAAPVVEFRGVPKFYEVRGSLELNCSSLNGKVTWRVNGTELDKVTQLKDHVTISSLKESEGGLLKINGRPTELDFGNYSCSNGVEELRFMVKANLHAKLPSDTNVVEGQKLKLTCKVIGRPCVGVLWTYSNESAEANTTDVLTAFGARVKLGPSDAGIKDAELIMESAERSDAGWYKCTPLADDDAAAVTPSITQLRVKDMYAALWPFLGICAEVFVLCAVILVYEKRRTKPELDDSDTDNHDQKKS